MKKKHDIQKFFCLSPWYDRLSMSATFASVGTPQSETQWRQKHIFNTLLVEIYAVEISRGSGSLAKINPANLQLIDHLINFVPRNLLWLGHSLKFVLAKICTRWNFSREIFTCKSMLPWFVCLQVSSTIHTLKRALIKPKILLNWKIFREGSTESSRWRNQRKSEKISDFPATIFIFDKCLQLLYDYILYPCCSG